MQYELRRSITDRLVEDGAEKVSWHAPLFWTCPSPKPEYVFLLLLVFGVMFYSETRILWRQVRSNSFQ